MPGGVSCEHILNGAKFLKRLANGHRGREGWSIWETKHILHLILFFKQIEKSIFSILYELSLSYIAFLSNFHNLQSVFIVLESCMY